MGSAGKYFYFIIIVGIIISLAFFFAGCEKINLSEIKTDCYYIGRCDADTYIIKFDTVGNDYLIGRSYKVEQAPVAERKNISIKAGLKKCSVKVNDVDMPVKLIPEHITADSITGTYSLGKEKHSFRIDRYNSPDYKDVEPQFQKEKYTVETIKDIVYGNAKGFWSYNPDKNETFAKAYCDKLGELLKYNISPRDIDLKMDIYLPKNDTSKLRPLLMLIHGGAFFNGDKASEAYVKWSTHFAKLGFVVASINYRMGFMPSADQIDCAGYRAAQDAHAAMRYLVHNAAKYRINTDWIFAGGTSAGAITALNLAFMRNKNRPESTRGGLFKSDLGDIESVSPQYKENFTIKAVANMWGAVHDINMISNAKTSVISFHGDADNIVPYGYDHPFNDVLDPIKIALRNDNSAEAKSVKSIFSLPLNKALTNKMYGSSLVDKMAKAKGNRSKLFTYPGGGHSLHVDKNNNLVPYFYFIQDSVTAFFVEELIPDPIKIVQDTNDRLVYKLNGKDVKSLYWKAENGIILSTSGRQARIIFLSDGGKKRITVSGTYKNGIGFKTELVL
ncbi:MAG: alpha/beta hydrolase [Bacteroidales bacterium]|nr:alpha/beta hydrolase [Bacteroidales bacterium]